MTTSNAILAVIIMAAITYSLRAIPFILFRKATPQIVIYLGKVLPYAIMGMLVVYCLKGISFAGLNSWLPEVIAGATVSLLYIWKKNTLLSIVAGTLLYMILVQFVFI